MTSARVAAGEGVVSSDTSSTTSVWPVAVVGVAVWVLAVVANAPLKLDHDVSYFLASGRILNAGARLYTDWIDFNTTAPSGLGRFSAWLAPVLGTPLDLTHKFIILLLALLGLAIAFGVLLPVLRKPGAPRWVLAIGIPVVLLFATPEIGRREHFLCIGAFPWAASIMLAGSRIHRPWPLAVAVGIAAGLALYEKPHFVLFGVALGLIDLLRARGRLDRLLVSTWVTAGVSISLYLWLIIANPDFLGVTLPATVDLYGALSHGWEQAGAHLASTSLLHAIGVALSAAALIYGTGNRPGWWAIGVATAFAGVSAAIFVIQGFGFEYHRLPLDIAFNLICVGLLAWGVSAARTTTSRTFHFAGLAAAGLLLAGALGSQLSFMSRYPHRDSISDSPLLQAMRPPQPGEPILIITTDVHPAAEIFTLLDARWSGAFISHFPIPTLIRQGGRDGIRHPLPDAKRQYWTEWFRKKMSARFCADLPVRVAVETSERPIFFQNYGFDMLAWLREDSVFDSCWRAARLSPAGQPIVTEQHAFQVYAASRDK